MEEAVTTEGFLLCFVLWFLFQAISLKEERETFRESSIIKFPIWEVLSFPGTFNLGFINRQMPTDIGINP